MPAAPVHCSCGRRVSIRAPPIGEMSDGAVTFRVEPSAAAAVEPPAAAEGEVGVIGLPLHAATVRVAARAAPDFQNVLVIHKLQRPGALEVHTTSASLPSRRH